jgi:hypothetical protein
VERVVALVRFLRAITRSVARKSLTGMDGVMVSPEGIEAWVRRSANRLTAHDFWLQVVDFEWVSHYPAVDGRSRPST